MSGRGSNRGDVKYSTYHSLSANTDFKYLAVILSEILHLQNCDVKFGIQTRKRRHGESLQNHEQYDLANKEKLFQMPTFQATCGHPLKLFQRRSWLNVQANSFSMRVIDNWNSLPTKSNVVPPVNSFKSRLNKHWHEHP